MILRALIKKYRDTIKNYYPAIALIPTILGGARQIAVLASINISYVRLFSITQVIPDGITIIMILLIMGIIILMTWMLIDRSSHNNNEDNIEASTEDLVLITLITLIIIGILLLIGRNFLLKHIIQIYIGIIIIIVLNKVIQIQRMAQLINKVRNKVKEFKELLIITITVLIFGIIIGSLYLINKSMFDIKNIEKIKLDLSNSGANTITTRYMNDKYIFFEIKNNSGTFIEIRPFEELFNQGSSNSN